MHAEEIYVFHAELLGKIIQIIDIIPHEKQKMPRIATGTNVGKPAASC